MRNFISQAAAVLVATVLVIVAFAIPLKVLADSAGYSQRHQVGKGFEIAARSDRSDRGFGDSKVVLQMVLRNAAGQVTTRELEIATFEKFLTEKIKVDGKAGMHPLSPIYLYVTFSAMMEHSPPRCALLFSRGFWWAGEMLCE